MSEIIFPFVVVGHPLRPDPEPEPPVEPAVPPYHGPRGLGLGIPWQMSDDGPVWQKVLAALRPAWWVDWRYDHLDQPDYYPIWFQTRADQEMYNTVQESKRHPGRFWLCGNEPDREPTQVAPEIAARDLRGWLAYAPTEFAAPGIQLNPNGYAWLLKYLDAGGPVPDAWHVHLYCANADHGLRMLNEFLNFLFVRNLTRPVILSETAVYNGYPHMQQAWWEALVAEMKQPGNPLVAAAHFAAYWPEWPWCCLTEADGSPKPFLAQTFAKTALST